MPIDTSMYRPEPAPERADYARMITLKQMMDDAPLRRQQLEQQVANQEQQRRIGEQTIHANQLKFDDHNRSLASQQAAQKIIAKHKGNLEQALADPEFLATVDASTMKTLKDGHIATQKSLADLDEQKWKVTKERGEAMATIYQRAISMPEADYQAAWPQIVAAVKKLNPEMQLPDQPIPQAALQRHFEMPVMMNATYLAQEEERRKNQLHKPAVDKAIADALHAKQQTTGEVPITPYQKEQLAQTANRNAALGDHEKAMEAIGRTNAQANVTRANKTGTTSDLVTIGIEEAAQSLARGELTRLRDIASLRGDQRLAIFARARQLNPAFSNGEIDRKITMEDYYANGKGADNLRSFGTFLEHGGAAADAIAQIRQSNIPIINKPLSWWRQNMSGDPAFTRLIAAIEPVRKEFESFLLGGRALYAEDRKAAEIILNENSSPAQIEQALKTMGHTAEARYNEENHRYKKVMGHDLKDPFSQEALVGGSKMGLKFGSGGHQQQSSGPAPIVQHSQSTGKYRHSIDGGRTWRDGKP